MRKICLLSFMLILTFSVLQSQNVSGRLVTSAYSWERYDSLNHSFNNFRLNETVQLDFNQNDYSLKTYFNIADDFGAALSKKTSTPKFYNLYFEKRNIFDVVDFKLGRIQVFSGIAIGAIDGAAFKLRAMGNDLIVNGFFGGLMPIDQTINIEKDIAHNNAFGLQIISKQLPNTSISLGYTNKSRKFGSYSSYNPDTILIGSDILVLNFPFQSVHANEQYASFDVYYNQDMFNAYLKYDLDLNYSTTYRGEFSLRYNINQNLGISAEYFHREPRIAYNSFFSVFQHSSTDEFGGGLDYFLDRTMSVFARFSSVKYSDDNSTRISVGFNSICGSISYSRDLGYVGDLDNLSAQVLYPLMNREAVLSGGLNYSSTKFKDQEKQNALAFSLGATIRPSKQLSFDLQGQMMMNEVYKSDFRVFFKFSYSFFSKLGIL